MHVNRQELICHQIELFFFYVFLCFFVVFIQQYQVMPRLFRFSLQNILNYSLMILLLSLFTIFISLHILITICFLAVWIEHYNGLIYPFLITASYCHTHNTFWFLIFLLRIKGKPRFRRLVSKEDNIYHREHQKTVESSIAVHWGWKSVSKKRSLINELTWNIETPNVK